MRTAINTDNLIDRMEYVVLFVTEADPDTEYGAVMTGKEIKGCDLTITGIFEVAEVKGLKVA